MSAPDGSTWPEDHRWLDRAEVVGMHGLGREGRSVLADLARRNPDARVLVFDDRAPQEAPTAGGRPVEVVVGAESAAAHLGSLDVLVRSPGIPLDHPLQAAARARGTPVTTSLNVFLARHRPDNVVAVTGTKGKSTTSMLLGHLLRATGQAVEVAGNVGVPVLDLPMAPGDLDTLVIELSSYQLADLRTPLAVGAWLNLHADHHTWHGSADAYARDKGRIVALSRTLVANAADPRVMAASADHPARVAFDASGAAVHLGHVVLPRRELEVAMDRTGLVGRHNVANLAAAATLAGLRGVEPRAAVAAAEGFEPLAHRLQVVHRDADLVWVDDSISTIPEAAVAALDAFPGGPIVLLAGGFDRGQDHAPLVAAVAARASGGAAVQVVAMPETGARLAQDLAAAGLAHLVTAVGDLDEAVAVAARRARRPGVVLLSPAAASFHAFASYAERGDRFAHRARTTT